MSTVQNNGGATGGVTGLGFRPGRSGNPGGRPQGLARATRELVGEDGRALAQLWWDIARDETRRDRDRLEASRLLADRGWGKAPTYAAIEEADRSTLPAWSRRRRTSGKESFGSLRGNRIPPSRLRAAFRAPLGAHLPERHTFRCRDVLDRRGLIGVVPDMGGARRRTSRRATPSPPCVRSASACRPAGLSRRAAPRLASCSFCERGKNWRRRPRTTPDLCLVGLVLAVAKAL